MEVARKPQRMEAMVAVLIEVSLGRSMKPTNGHINDNGSIFELPGTYKVMAATACHPRRSTTLNVPFSTHLVSTGREGFLPFTFSSQA